MAVRIGTSFRSTATVWVPRSLELGIPPFLLLSWADWQGKGIRREELGKD